MPSKLALVFMAVVGFTLLGSWPYLAWSEADGPDYWAVQGVSHADHLNLRKGPSVKFSVVAQIPSGFAHLENLGCSPAFTIKDWERFSEYERDVAVSLRWCRVRFHDHVGLGQRFLPSRRCQARRLRFWSSALYIGAFLLCLFN